VTETDITCDRSHTVVALGEAMLRPSCRPGERLERAGRLDVHVAGSEANDDRQGSAFAGMTADEIDVAILSGASWAVISGITPALGPRSRALTEHFVYAARERGAAVCVDVNYRAKLWGPMRRARRSRRWSPPRSSSRGLLWGLQDGELAEALCRAAAVAGAKCTLYGDQAGVRPGDVAALLAGDAQDILR
jgi:sugar/nucleoside kinase (ribokinase family)